MDSVTILAQTLETAGLTTQGKVVPVELFWNQVTSLELLEALTFISFGVVCLFYGWRVFKILVVISFALIGLMVGVYTNQRLIGGSGVWMGIIAMVLFAVFSVPMMRWGVSILGAAAGGILTGGAWYALRLPEQYIWAGGLVGVIAGGMISFIIFKNAVLLVTSFGGSVLVVVGALAIMYDYMSATVDVQQLLFTQKWFLPAALLGPMAVGIFCQNKFIKGSHDWSV